jgi:NAD/NADP transhydrogenase beta subunit
MKFDDRIKTALSENRLLILGTQVLFGFQFNGIFQEQFEFLDPLARGLECSGLTLLMLSVAFLIAPSMEHRIVEGGQNSVRVLKLANFFAGWALLPLSIALAFDMYVAMERMVGSTGGIVTGCVFFAIAVSCLYVLAFAMQRKETKMPDKQSSESTPLAVQVDQLLTEARLIIPGAQALLGFQLTVTLTKAFTELPAESKIAHAAALCCTGIAVLFLMAPASLHRIAFNGEDDPEFVKVGSWFVIAAPLPLAFAIALDTYVAAGRAVQSPTTALLLAGVAIGVLLGAWYAFPIWRRAATQVR